MVRGSHRGSAELAQGETDGTILMDEFTIVFVKLRLLAWIRSKNELPPPAIQEEEKDYDPSEAAKSYYGESASAWSRSSALASTEDSTTAGTSSVNESESDSGAASSSSSSVPENTVGFWRHGTWIARPRTEAERRARGDRGSVSLEGALAYFLP